MPDIVHFSLSSGRYFYTTLILFCDAVKLLRKSLIFLESCLNDILDRSVAILRSGTNFSPLLKEDLPESSTQCPMDYEFFQISVWKQTLVPSLCAHRDCSLYSFWRILSLAFFSFPAYPRGPSTSFWFLLLCTALLSETRSCEVSLPSSA